jgi:hypothetical protein
MSYFPPSSPSLSSLPPSRSPSLTSIWDWGGFLEIRRSGGRRSLKRAPAPAEQTYRCRMFRRAGDRQASTDIPSPDKRSLNVLSKTHALMFCDYYGGKFSSFSKVDFSRELVPPPSPALHAAPPHRHFKGRTRPFLTTREACLTSVFGCLASNLILCMYVCMCVCVYIYIRWWSQMRGRRRWRRRWRSWR